MPPYRWCRAGRTRPAAHTLLQVSDEEARAELPLDDEVRFAEVLRVSPEAAELAASLLLALFPNRSWGRAHVGRLTAYFARPPLDQAGAWRLFDKLFELSERPEWRARHAMAREVTDVTGRRLELLVPVPPEAYEGGEGLVGPFATFEDANAWGMSVQARELAADALQAGDAWLCELFRLGELLED